MLDIYKQRYWNESGKKMEYLTDWSKCSYWGDCVLEGVFNDPDDKNLMFCTGEKDKNNKLIYDKDIVTAIIGSTQDKIITTGVVELINCTYFINDIKSKGNQVWLCADCIDSKEIIGNIYENPELLNFTPQ